MNYERFHAALARECPACAAAYRGECGVLGTGLARVGGVAWSETACLLLGVLLEDRAVETRYPLPGWPAVGTEVVHHRTGTGDGRLLDKVLASADGPLDEQAHTLLTAIVAGWAIGRNREKDTSTERGAIVRGLHLRCGGWSGHSYNGLLEVACGAIPLAMLAVDVDLAAVYGQRERVWLDCDMTWLRELTRAACGGYSRQVLDACIDAGIGDRRGRGHALRDAWAARAVLGGLWSDTAGMVQATGKPDWGVDIAFITGGQARAAAGVLRLFTLTSPPVEGPNPMDRPWAGRIAELMKMAKAWSGSDWSEAARVLDHSPWDALVRRAHDCVEDSAGFDGDAVNSLGRLCLAFEGPLAAGRAMAALGQDGGRNVPQRGRRRS